MSANILQVSNKIPHQSSPLTFSVLAWISLCSVPHLALAQAPATPKPVAPEWAQPGSATHTQVAPPPDFHRPSTNFATPIGIFERQSDIVSAVVPGSERFDASTR